MAKVTILVGVPGSGKSTSRKSLVKSDDFVYSTDDVIEQMAMSAGKTYDEIWSDNIKEATKIANDMLFKAIKEGRDVVCDRTNMTAGSRKKLLSLFDPKIYEFRIAEVFPFPPDDILRKRLASRQGKTIPWFVIEKMEASYEHPSYKEGFTSIHFRAFEN